MALRPFAHLPSLIVGGRLRLLVSHCSAGKPGGGPSVASAQSALLSWS